VRGPHKSITFTDAEKNYNTTIRKLDQSWGFSIGNSEKEFFATGKIFVNIASILSSLHQNVPNLSDPFKPTTNMKELTNALGATAIHEFGHTSGLVYGLFYKTTDIPDPPPVPGAYMKLSAGDGHYNHNELHNRTLRLIMADGTDLIPLDVRLWRGGSQQWTEYDKVHLQHQYLTD